MRSYTTRFIASAFLLGLSTTASQAQSLYTNESNFLGANVGASTVSFAGQTPVISNSLGTSTSLGGVTFKGNNLRYVNTTFWGNKASLLDDRWHGGIEASFAPVSALGFYFASNYNDGAPITFTAYNGAQQVFARSITGGGVYSAFSYFGIDNVGPITSFRLSTMGANDFASLAELSLLGWIPPEVEEETPTFTERPFNTNTVVPEPSSFALMFAGGAALLVVARRRRTA